VTFLRQCTCTSGYCITKLVFITTLTHGTNSERCLSISYQQWPPVLPHVKQETEPRYSFSFLLASIPLGTASSRPNNHACCYVRFSGPGRPIEWGISNFPIRGVTLVRHIKTKDLAEIVDAVGGSSLRQISSTPVQTVTCLVFSSRDIQVRDRLCDIT